MSQHLSKHERKQKEIADLVAAECAFVDRVQMMVDYGNDKVLKTFKLRLIMDDAA